VKDKAAFDALSPEHQQELRRRNAAIARIIFDHPGSGERIVANKEAGMPLEEAIFQAGYISGVEFQKGRQEAVWVKTTDRLPGWNQPVYWRIGEGPQTKGKTPLSEMFKGGYLENWQWLDESAGGKDDWISVDDQLPAESGRYWCYVEELTCLGASAFQWNCSYHAGERRFSDKSFTGGERITYWRPLPTPPKRG
jgi:hypothetical protein